jgi:hypothetical protein
MTERQFTSAPASEYERWAKDAAEEAERLRSIGNNYAANEADNRARYFKHCAQIARKEGRP